MQVSRRTLLATVAPGAILTLAGCGTTPVNPSVWIAGIQAIATEVGQIVGQLQAAGISAATIAQVQSIVASIQAAAAAVGTAVTQTAGQSILIQIEGYINALVPILQPFLSLVPGVGSILGIIVIALPAIEAALNIIVGALTPAAAALGALAPPLPLTAAPGFDVHVAYSYLNMLIQRAAAVKARKLRYR